MSTIDEKTTSELAAACHEIHHEIVIRTGGHLNLEHMFMRQVMDNHQQILNNQIAIGKKLDEMDKEIHEIDEGM